MESKDTVDKFNLFSATCLQQILLFSPSIFLFGLAWILCTNINLLLFNNSLRHMRYSYAAL